MTAHEPGAEFVWADGRNLFADPKSIFNKISKEIEFKKKKKTQSLLDCPNLKDAHRKIVIKMKFVCPLESKIKSQTKN
jgi:hypothetical protein